MIKHLTIQNFKCFESLNLELKNINILTGLNGMGKSTVIQSLLLLRQSYFDNKLSGLKLNGRYLKLGNGQDVLFENAQKEEICFDVQETSGKYSFSFSYAPLSDLLIRNTNEAECQGESVLFGDRFTYLSAYRIDPRDLYGIRDAGDMEWREFSNTGEYAIQYLDLYGNSEVNNRAVCIGSRENNTVWEQVRLWLEEISPGIIPKISINKELRTAELRYEFTEGKTKTNPYKSVNVGFGITYVLPIIVALVTARPGDLVLLENPEAHIHPAGQRRLGELAAAAASGGVQIIMETHSDHILNGIRTAVKKRIADCGQTAIFFFYKDESDEFRHKVEVPSLDAEGRIDIWPKGFFDEWDNALLELL